MSSWLSKKKKTEKKDDKDGDADEQEGVEAQEGDAAEDGEEKKEETGEQDPEKEAEEAGAAAAAGQPAEADAGQAAEDASGKPSEEASEQPAGAVSGEPAEAASEQPAKPADGADASGQPEAVEGETEKKPARRGGWGKNKQKEVVEEAVTPATGDQAAGDQATGDQASGDQTTGDQATGDQAIGDQATGDQPTGDQATVEQAASAEGQTVPTPETSSPAPQKSGRTTVTIQGSGGTAKAKPKAQSELMSRPSVVAAKNDGFKGKHITMKVSIVSGGNLRPLGFKSVVNTTCFCELLDSEQKPKYNTKWHTKEIKDNKSPLWKESHSWNEKDFAPGDQIVFTVHENNEDIDIATCVLDSKQFYPKGFDGKVTLKSLETEVTEQGREKKKLGAEAHVKVKIVVESEELMIELKNKEAAAKAKAKKKADKEAAEDAANASPWEKRIAGLAKSTPRVAPGQVLKPRGTPVYKRLHQLHGTLEEVRQERIAAEELKRDEEAFSLRTEAKQGTEEEITDVVERLYGYAAVKSDRLQDRIDKHNEQQLSEMGPRNPQEYDDPQAIIEELTERLTAVAQEKERKLQEKRAVRENAEVDYCTNNTVHKKRKQAPDEERDEIFTRLHADHAAKKDRVQKKIAELDESAVIVKPYNFPKFIDKGMRLTVIAGRRLSKPSVKHTPEPFVICSFPATNTTGGSHRAEMKTRQVKWSDKPTWNQQFDLTGFFNGEGPLIFKVMSDDCGEVSVLGCAMLEPSQFSEKGFDGELRLNPPSEDEILSQDVAMVRSRLMASGYSQGGLNLKRLYKELDKDGTGALSVEELIRAIRRDAKVTADVMPDNMVKKLFARMDTSGDGFISLEEFSVFMDRKPEQRITQVAPAVAPVVIEEDGENAEKAEPGAEEGANAAEDADKEAVPVEDVPVKSKKELEKEKKEQAKKEKEDKAQADKEAKEKAKADKEAAKNGTKAEPPAEDSEASPEKGPGDAEKDPADVEKPEDADKPAEEGGELAIDLSAQLDNQESAFSSPASPSGKRVAMLSVKLEILHPKSQGKKAFMEASATRMHKQHAALKQKLEDKRANESRLGARQATPDLSVSSTTMPKVEGESLDFYTRLYADAHRRNTEKRDKVKEGLRELKMAQENESVHKQVSQKAYSTEDVGNIFERIYNPPVKCFKSRLVNKQAGSSKGSRRSERGSPQAEDFEPYDSGPIMTPSGDDGPARRMGFFFNRDNDEMVSPEQELESSSQYSPVVSPSPEEPPASTRRDKNKSKKEKRDGPNTPGQTPQSPNFSSPASPNFADNRRTSGDARKYPGDAPAGGAVANQRNKSVNLQGGQETVRFPPRSDNY